MPDRVFFQGQDILATDVKLTAYFTKKSRLHGLVRIASSNSGMPHRWGRVNPIVV